MDLETLISEAKARQKAKTEAYREEMDARAVQAGEILRNQFIAAFGDDMLTMLDGYVSSPFDDVARITFRYQERDFSLRRRYMDGVCDWVLTWLAPREDGEDRLLPFVTISETRRDSQANLDAFVLALSEIAETKDSPRYTRQSVPEPIVPRVINEYEERLLDALRLFLQHEI